MFPVFLAPFLVHAGQASIVRYVIDSCSLALRPLANHQSLSRKRTRISMMVPPLLASLLGSFPALAQDPATVGQWSSVMTWPYEPIHAHLLPTGKVICWTRDAGDKSWLWD